MAHFYSTVSSKGTTHTKCGNKDGMRSSTDGWDIGASVQLYHDGKKDIVTVIVGGGSNGDGGSILLGSYAKVDGVITKIED